MDAGAYEVLLAGHAQPQVGGAGDYYRRAGAVLVARLGGDGDVRAFPPQRPDTYGGEELDAVALRLLDHAFSELGAADALREAGIVVDTLGGASLSPQRALLDDQGVDALTSAVDGRRQAGRTPADDDQVIERALRLEAKPQLLGQLIVAGLHQEGAFREDDGRDDLLAIVLPTNEVSRCLVLIDVDPLIGDAHLTQELLGAAAIGAPGRSVHLDLIAHRLLLRDRLARLNMGLYPKDGMGATLSLPFGGIRWARDIGLPL